MEAERSWGSGSQKSSRPKVQAVAWDAGRLLSDPGCGLLLGGEQRPWGTADVKLKKGERLEANKP